MVFISYSSKDTEAANAVRMVLQQNGIDCWMAPESIPMGGDYSNAIPNAVEECDLFLLILSKNSQESNWVPKELDLAITYNKQIIPFQIEKGNLTKPFNFRLTNVQRIEAFHNLETAYSQLVCQIKNIVNIQPISCENVDLVMPTASETLMNVDDQLIAKFDEIFGDEKKSDDMSPLQKKIQEAQEKRFWNDMEKRMELVEEADEPNDSEFDYTQSLIPIPSEFRDFLLDSVGVTGKHFTLPNLNGYKTIAFEVLKCVDYKSMTYFFNCEPLDYYTDIEQENDGVSQTIYFVDEPKDAGCQLLFLHFNPIIGKQLLTWH